MPETFAARDVQKRNPCLDSKPAAAANWPSRLILWNGLMRLESKDGQPRHNP